MASWYKNYRSLQEKINDFVINRVETESGCWLPPTKYYGRTKKGYFMFRCKGKRHYLHRVVLERLVLKRQLREGFMTCHILECQNKDCFNPNHLYEGTNKDNMRDMCLLGNSISTFSDEDIQFIRDTYATRQYSQKQLARMFDTTPSNIHNIVNRKTHKHKWVKP